ncbi:dihydrofolate reductase family protein [Cohnella sp. 56]|uniref:dihydrofolate reductase family protein n=1 Tax=Cohnella sp. 56 TaxID=3113722 RepID=UPI0030E79AFD
MTRRIILDLAVTLDGYIEGKNGETDWCIMDPEMGFNQFLDQIDTIIYGRQSYDQWGQYVPGNDQSYDGASLITSFINAGLVDEFRLSVHPVVLGEGKPLFIDIRQRLNLELVRARTFSSGVVQVVYRYDEIEIVN